MQEVVKIPRVIHVHGYFAQMKFSQDFEYADFNQGPKHNFILRYQVSPLNHAGTHSALNSLIVYEL